jgi:hypothetical protein
MTSNTKFALRKYAKVLAAFPHLEDISIFMTPIKPARGTHVDNNDIDARFKRAADSFYGLLKAAREDSPTPPATDIRTITLDRSQPYLAKDDKNPRTAAFELPPSWLVDSERVCVFQY